MDHQTKNREHRQLAMALGAPHQAAQPALLCGVSLRLAGKVAIVTGCALSSALCGSLRRAKYPLLCLPALICTDRFGRLPLPCIAIFTGWCRATL